MEFLKKENELEDVVSYIKNIAKNGGIFLLRGDVASGKTTLVKGFAKFLGIKDDVSSPTFSILNIYEDKIYHYDIYNKGVGEFVSMGLLETLEESGYHFIEWADEKLENILKEYGFGYFIIEIESKGDKRVYRITNA